MLIQSSVGNEVLNESRGTLTLTATTLGESRWLMALERCIRRHSHAMELGEDMPVITIETKATIPIRQGT